MSFLIEGETGREAYARAVHAVLEDGEPVSPRQRGTLEVRGAHLVVSDPRDAYPSNVNRKGLRIAIGVAEALQLVAGVSRPDLLCKIAPAFEIFREPAFGNKMHGAYGPRVSDRMREIIRLLAVEPDSRQAVVAIWDNYSDLAPYRRGGTGPRPPDIPCTVSLHFFVRGGRLELHTHMRSNDVWLGLPYDLVQFTVLQLSVANALGVTAGAYHHHADSLHVYDRDASLAADVWKTVKPRDDVTTFTGVGRLGMSWEEIQKRAVDVLDGRGLRASDRTWTEKLFAEKLRPFQ